MFAPIAYFSANRIFRIFFRRSVPHHSRRTSSAANMPSLFAATRTGSLFASSLLKHSSSSSALSLPISYRWFGSGSVRAQRVRGLLVDSPCPHSSSRIPDDSLFVYTASSYGKIRKRLPRPLEKLLPDCHSRRHQSLDVRLPRSSDQETGMASLVDPTLECGNTTIRGVLFVLYLSIENGGYRIES